MTKPATPSEHPTLVPLYDVEKAARDAVSIPPAGRAVSIPPDTARGPREEMPTFTDEVELEAARVKSTFTVPPPSAGPAPAAAPVEAPPPPSEPLTPEALETEYERRFGGFDKVPVMVAPREQVAALAMDGRASMLLALLDGRSSVQALLDIGILNRVDTLSGLAELVERGVIILLG